MANDTIQKVEIWHYPRCSKSRQTLALLEERGVEPQIRKYRQDPPDADTLAEVLDMLGMSPRELMRKKEDAYKELGLDDESLSRDALLEAMVENPALIERPIVLADGKAVLGRPPENVLELFE